MSLGLAHELALALTTSIAFLVALLGGAVSPFAWAVLVSPWLSMFLRMTNRAAPATSGTVIALASLGLGVATLVQRGAEAAVLAAGYALMGLLVARVLTRTTLAHDLQALLLALLLVIAAAVLNIRLSYAPAFLAFGVTVVWSLITRELLRGAERAARGDEGRLLAMRARTDVVTAQFLATTSAVAIAILLATSVLFVVFPRVGFQSLGISSSSHNRLPPSVSLRGLPRASAGGGDVVARVYGVGYESFERGLYLRGAVYEDVGEQGFSRKERPPRVPSSLLALAGAPADASYEVHLTPGTDTTLLALGHVRGAVGLSGGRTNPNDRVYVRGVDQRGELRAQSTLRSALRYRVQGGVAAPGFIPERDDERRSLDDEGEAAAFFALPADVDARVVALADEVAAGATDPVVIAQRLRAFLLTEFRYSLEQPNALAERPLTAFLLDDRRGHCEYFAAAFALLLRAKGIASRVIGGYQGGAWDPQDEVVVVTGANAHAWVEWYLPKKGWIVDDPTPLARAARVELRGLAALIDRLQRFWDDRVLDYALVDQADLVRKVRQALVPDDEGASPAVRNGVLAAVAVVVVVAAAAVALLRRRRRHFVGGGASHDALTRALLDALARYRNDELSPTSTVREALAGLAGIVAAERAALERALACYEALRFGAKKPSDHEVRQVTALLKHMSPAPSTASSRQGTRMAQ